MSSNSSSKPSEEEISTLNYSRHVSTHDKVNNPNMDDSTDSFGDSFAASDDEDVMDNPSSGVGSDKVEESSKNESKS